MRRGTPPRHRASARFQAFRSVCCEPTWNETPCATSPSSVGAREDVDGLAGDAAELSAERPFGAGAVGQDAAEDARAGRGAGDLLHLLDAVDGEERHAERVRAGNVALLLDGVAVGDAARRRRRSPSTISISGTEAASKEEPSEARRLRTSGAGLAFTA